MIIIIVVKEDFDYDPSQYIYTNMYYKEVK